MGTSREVAEAGGFRSDHIGKVLPVDVPGGDNIWVQNLGDVGSYAYKYRGGARGFTSADDGCEGAKARGRDLEKGGSGQVASGGRK